ncbi:DUF6463 family protein [Paenibacillus alkalitolerans]|uniref:DUF6463 family protein n=1 Tax=Paenibacillus alkalitolerans TaxID=2799335 RepID=UPI0018F6E4F3|nr:DUF6463 family protein [Paenibacillus alkalitolerans]
MVRGIKRRAGLFLMLTGWLHTAVGLILYRKQLQEILADGLWNTAPEGEWEAMTVFWFMMFGFMLIYLGYTADWLLKKKGIAPPPAFGWILLAICLAGVVVMPVSGFWLVLPQAWILLRN